VIQNKRPRHPYTAGKYWAAETEPEAFASFLTDRIDRFYDDVESSGRANVWRRIQELSFGRDPDNDRTSAQLVFGGGAGETTELRINHFRAVLDQVYAITTQTRPSFEAKADNGDSRTLAERQIAEAIVDHHLDEPDGLEDAAKKVARIAIHMTEGYLYLWWDDQGGAVHGVEPYLEGDDLEKQSAYEEERAAYDEEAAMLMSSGIPANDNGGLGAPQPPEAPQVEWKERLKYKGAPRFMAVAPEDLIRDPDIEGGDWQWVAVRRMANRWDLAAVFPKHADFLRTVTTDERLDKLNLRRKRNRRTDSDQVSVYEFYHLPSHSLPQGRYAILCDDQVIHDGPMPYRRLPVIPCVPGHEFHEPYGYGPAADMLAIQQAYDAVASIIVSNIEALGLQKLWTPRGQKPDAYEMGFGLVAVESDVKPEPLKLLESTETQEKAIEWLHSEIGQMGSVSDVSRGAPPPSLKSGVSLTYMDGITIRNNSPTQGAWARMLQAAASFLIELYQDFGTVPRIIEIAGKSKTYQATEFTADKIKGVRSVSVDLGNPLARTVAGRTEVAQMFFEKGAISPQQFFEIIETGRLEPMTESAESSKLLIVNENEMLRSGVDENGAAIQALVSKYDPHHLHIPEHEAVLDDPMSRYDQAVTQRVRTHDDLHRYWWNFLSRFEPDSAMARGIPILPPPVAPIMPPPELAALGMPPIAPLPPPMPMGPGAPGGGPGAPAGGPPGPANDNAGPMPGAPADGPAGASPGPGMPGMPEGSALPPEVAAQAMNPSQ
jgi:hypothetical protein